jgi:hypothetical protein
MAKSPRIGENQGRRVSDKRRAAEAQSPAAEPLQSTAHDRRSRTVVLPAGRAGVTKAQIAARAYELYVARGGKHGYDIADWLQAEHELLGR